MNKVDVSVRKVVKVPKIDNLNGALSRYGFIGIIRLIRDVTLSKFISLRIRLIHCPYYLRGIQGIEFSEGFTSGAKDNVFYDPDPYLLYRLHDAALGSGNNSFVSKIERFKILWFGRIQGWNTQNIEVLKEVRHLPAKNHQENLRLFEALKGANLRDGLRLMRICGLHRQTSCGTFSLYLAILFKKI